jgi:hypothetical protein
MDPIARLAYVGCVVVLFLKLVFLVSLQGRVRAGSRRFRWPEDAAAFGGEIAGNGEDDARVERAQAALRNDGESQWLFLLAGGAWVTLGASPAGAVVAFAAYALLRCVHTALMLRPSQPGRTRVFGLGLLVTLAVLADAARLAIVTLV